MSKKRFKENPFINGMTIPLGNKQIQISPIGKDNNIIVSQNTGEVLGGTSVITYKKVDQSKFIKLFTENIKLAFELTQAGQKALFVLFWTVQQKTINKDLITLDQYTLEEFLIDNNELKMSIPTFKRGISELVKAQIVAMSKRKGDYFINPNFLFNGNRIAFTTVLENEKIKKGSQLNIDDQINGNK